MNLTAEDLARGLIKIYKRLGKRFYLKKEMFRGLANRYRLHDSFLWQVNAELHKKGYTLIDMRSLPKRKHYIAVIKVKIISENWEFLTRKKFRNLKLVLLGKGP